MSLGSKRITLRIGDAMRDDIEDSVRKRNDANGATKFWTISEYCIQAIVDKMNHDRRSRKSDDRRRQAKIDDNQPREYWEE